MNSSIIGTWVVYIQKAGGALKEFWDIDFILGNIEVFR